MGEQQPILHYIMMRGWNWNTRVVKCRIFARQGPQFGRHGDSRTLLWWFCLTLPPQQSPYSLLPTFYRSSNSQPNPSTPHPIWFWWMQHRLFFCFFCICQLVFLQPASLTSDQWLLSHFRWWPLSSAATGSLYIVLFLPLGSDVALMRTNCCLSEQQ